MNVVACAGCGAAEFFVRRAPVGIVYANALALGEAFPEFLAEQFGDYDDVECAVMTPRDLAALAGREAQVHDVAMFVGGSLVDYVKGPKPDSALLTLVLLWEAPEWARRRSRERWAGAMWRMCFAVAAHRSVDSD